MLTQASLPDCRHSGRVAHPPLRLLIQRQAPLYLRDHDNASCRERSPGVDNGNRTQSRQTTFSSELVKRGKAKLSQVPLHLPYFLSSVKRGKALLSLVRPALGDTHGRIHSHGLAQPTGSPCCLSLDVLPSLPPLRPRMTCQRT